MAPYVLLVWTEAELRRDAYPIPMPGLVLGRDLVRSSDDRISREHAWLAIDGEALIVRDLASRNGTWVNRVATFEEGVRVRLPATIRTGRSVWLALPELGQPSSPRLDQLPARLVGVVEELAPGAKIHASAIEAALVRATEIDEVTLLRLFARSVVRWRKTSFADLYDEDLDLDLDPAAPKLRGPIGHPVQPRRRGRRTVVRPTESASWETRRLCEDGSCIGVIGADGRCRVCGRPASTSGSPYR